jgi:hypothetical protein
VLAVEPYVEFGLLAIKRKWLLIKYPLRFRRSGIKIAYCFFTHMSKYAVKALV